MTEFAVELRHRCRNSKCRSKLPTSVANEREAFCTRGCHASFYRERCLVCERGMRLICNKGKCRNAWRGIGFGRLCTIRCKINSRKARFYWGKTAPQTRSSAALEADP
jgi:hypothetical protein